MILLAEGLKFYDEMFDEMHRLGIEPVITLSHFEMPYHLAEKYNGFVVHLKHLI